MNYQQVKKCLLSKPVAIEDYPFGPVVEVFKVEKKMFATLVVQDKVARMNLKCDPNEALMLRDVFDAVVPAYHMNKTHWNTIILDGSVPDGEIERMIDRSYGLVVKGLKKPLRESLELVYGVDQLYK